MSKQKIGDRINTPTGTMIVERVSKDGHIVVKDIFGRDYVLYNKDNDESLGKDDFHGVVVRYSDNKKLRNSSVKVFNSKIQAENWAKVQARNLRSQGFYYRIEDRVVRKCKICGRIHVKSEDCVCMR